MADEWRQVTVGDLADSISDTHKFGKDRLVFLNTSDVLLGKIFHHSYSVVRDWPGQAKKSIRKGDILFSEIRPANGRWAYVDVEADDYVVSTKLMVIRSRTNIVLPRFLYHFLTSTKTTSWLQHLAESRSGTFPQITFDQIAELQLTLPSLSVQARIAGFFDTIDGKIELNRRMNESLEGIAQTLFKSWFVDFDPVRANVEGHDSGLPKALADLFPDSFDDSERGAIPKGWQRGTIGALATLSRKSVIPGDFPNEVFDHYSIPAYDNGCMPKQETGELIKSNKFLILPECVLLSKLNPRIPRIWMPNVKAGRRSVCSTEYLVVLPKPDVPRVFLYCLFSNNAFVSEFATFVTGTSGSHQRVKPENLLQMSCIIAPEPVVNRVASIVKPILERVSGNIAQSCTLAVLRDTLLPRLLSGKIRVKNAKRISGESTFGNLPRVLKPHISSARTPADKGEDV